MKKMLSLILALAMILTLGTVTAFAAPITATGDTTADVFATYQAGDTAATVYSVEVTWGKMEFTYTSASEGAWDPATRTFSSITPAAWTVKETDGDTITVTNSSNAEVNVALTFTHSTDAPDVTGSFTIGTAGTAGTSFTLDTAVGTESTAAPSNFARFVPGGSISAGENVKIGTITVALS